MPATHQQDRMIDELERELDNPNLTKQQRRDIMEELRDIGQEISDHERWEDEGFDRGWR